MGRSSPRTFLHYFKPPCSLKIHCSVDGPAWLCIPSPQATSNSQATAPFSSKAAVRAIHMSHSMSLLPCALESLLSQLSPELPPGPALEKDAWLSAPVLLVSSYYLLYLYPVQATKMSTQAAPHCKSRRNAVRGWSPLPAAAPHAWGCALRKAGLKSERTEAENNVALALSALSPQGNPRQSSAWSHQQFHGTSDAPKSWRDWQPLGLGKARRGLCQTDGKAQLLSSPGDAGTLSCVPPHLAPEHAAHRRSPAASPTKNSPFSLQLC